MRAGSPRGSLPGSLRWIPGIPSLLGMPSPGIPVHSPAFPGIPRHSPAFPGTPRHSPALPGILRHSPAFPCIPRNSPAFPGIPVHSPGIPLHSPAFQGRMLPSKRPPFGLREFEFRLRELNSEFRIFHRARDGCSPASALRLGTGTHTQANRPPGSRTPRARPPSARPLDCFQASGIPARNPGRNPGRKPGRRLAPWNPLRKPWRAELDCAN